MMHLFLTTIIILRLFKRLTRFSYYRREKVFVTVNHTQKVSSLKEVLDLKDKNPGQTWKLVFKITISLGKIWISHKMRMCYFTHPTYSYSSLHSKKNSSSTVSQSDKPKNDSISHGRHPSSLPGKHMPVHSSLPQKWRGITCSLYQLSKRQNKGKREKSFKKKTYFLTLLSGDKNNKDI